MSSIPKQTILIFKKFLLDFKILNSELLLADTSDDSNYE